MKTTQCDQWVERDNKVMARCSRMVYYPFVIAKGYGATVEDADGNKFLDLLASSGSLNMGHSHPEIVAAVEEQIKHFTHNTTAFFYSPPAIEMAEKLTSITPGNFEKRVVFGLTGSDANDGAIKFARGYTRREKLVAFKGAYHGSTYGAISLSYISLNMRRRIGPSLPEVYCFDYPDVYRNGPDDGERCLRQIEEAFSSYLPPDEVAAFIIEPLQGDAGIVVPPKKFMQDLAALCKKHGILLISEEVQQAFLRTGKWYGIEHFDVVPDLIIMGKPIGGGLPLSAVVGRAEVMNSLEPPAHMFTFSGAALSCATGLATIKYMSRPEFRAELDSKISLMRGLLDKLKDKYELVGDVRGLGLSLGVELVKDRRSKIRDVTAGTKISYRAWEKGMIMITLAGNVLRIQPPLVITEDEIRRAVKIIDECIHDYVRGDIPDEVLNVVKGW